MPALSVCFLVFCSVSLLVTPWAYFLYEQKEEVRAVFVCRYFDCDSVEMIAEKFGFSHSKVKSVLMRTRMKLRQYLEQEGYYE